MADGDGRAALTLAEEVWRAARPGEIFDAAGLQDVVQRRAPIYDKKQDGHYNLISALHKSVRGSDPDAALYYLARMLDAGEDPLYLARRVVRMAVEDIGLADPQALVICNAAKDAYDFLGSPEGELAIAQAVIYVATAPKSNAAYTAYGAAKRAAKEAGSLLPPKHILNAPTKLMKSEGYGRGYAYDHDAEEAFSGQDYFPEELGRQTFYDPPERGFEREIRKRLDYWAKLRKDKAGADAATYVVGGLRDRRRHGVVRARGRAVRRPLGGQARGLLGARRRHAATAALVATDTSLWWFDGYCRIGKMYKAQGGLCAGACGGKGDVPVTLDAQRQPDAGDLGQRQARGDAAVQVNAPPVSEPLSVAAAPSRLFGHRAFALYWVGRIVSILSFQMLMVAIGWQLYSLTGSALDLGLLGLAQFVPMLVLTLLVGHVADRYDHRAILLVCQAARRSPPRSWRSAPRWAGSIRWSIYVVDRAGRRGPRLRNPDHGGDHPGAGAARAGAGGDRLVRLRQPGRPDRRPGAGRPALRARPGRGLRHRHRAVVHRRGVHRHDADGARAALRRAAEPALADGRLPLRAAATASSSAPSRSTCARCSWPAPARCFRSSPATSCRPGRGASACCARRPRSARWSCRSCWRGGR